jgi:hypothetical protein
MKNEAEFMVLDGAMIALACILMTVAHPGIFFPAIGSRNRRASEKERDVASPVEAVQSESDVEKSHA